MMKIEISLTFVFILTLFQLFTAVKKKKLDKIESFCSGISPVYGCITFDLGFVDDLIYNSSTCMCSFHGFPQVTCADSIFTDVQHWNDRPEVTFDAILNNTKDMLKHFAYFITKYGHCIDIPTSSKQIRIPVVDSCSENASDIYRNMCTDPSSSFPPYEFRMHVSVVFKNAFCALCNGIDVSFIKHNMKGWNSNFTCKDEELAGNPITATDNNCQVTFDPPSTWIDLNQCQILHESVMELNKICDGCDPGLNTTSECILCKFTYVGYDPYCGDPLSYQPSLRTLFEIPDENEVLVNGRMRDGSELCGNDERYDPLFITCRKIVCAFDEFPSQGRCMKNSTVILGPNSQLQPNGTKLINLTVVHSFSQWREFNIPIIVNDLAKRFDILSQIFTFENYTSKVRLQLDLTNSSGKDLLKFITSLQREKEDNSLMRFTLSNFPLPQDGACLSEIVCSNVTKLVLPFSWIAETLVENRTFRAPVFNSIFKLTVESGLNSSTINLNTFCFCLPSPTHSLNCSLEKFLYKKHEFNVSDDGILTLRNKKLTLQRSQYEIIDDGVIVCFNPGLFRAFFDMDQTQVYVSLACTSLSIICLILTIICYCMLPELRNLPGKLTMGLSLSLIIAQVLFIFPDLPKPICRYLSTVTHYSWLTVFMWMAAIAVNILRTFHPKSLSLHNGSTLQAGNAFIVMACICMISPAILCIILLVLDQLPGDHLHVNYGQVSCMWMSNIDGYIYMFFVPVGTVLVISTVCFSLTLYYIEQSMAASVKVTGRKRDRDRCVMYLKLSSVMGLSWIFGFVASLSQVEALWYVYIVLNGLQGVFIFFSFGMTSRTRKMASQRFSKKSKYFDNSKTSVTTVTS